jgi:hypothetical protein
MWADDKSMWVCDSPMWAGDKSMWVCGSPMWADDKSMWICDSPMWADDESMWMYGRPMWADDKSIWAEDEIMWAEGAGESRQDGAAGRLGRCKPAGPTGGAAKPSVGGWKARRRRTGRLLVDSVVKELVASRGGSRSGSRRAGIYGGTGESVWGSGADVFLPQRWARLIRRRRTRVARRTVRSSSLTTDAKPASRRSRDPRRLRRMPSLRRPPAAPFSAVEHPL